jgi:hypothetical protein
MMKLCSQLIALFFLVGCSNSKPLADLQAQSERQQARITEVERALSDVRQAQLEKKPQENFASNSAVEEIEKTLARVAKSVERVDERLAGLDARISSLEKQRAPASEDVKPPLGKILPSRPPEISIYAAPDHRLADFIETPDADNPDLFPLRISNVEGRKTVVGTHQTTRIVESGETYKDDYGRRIPHRKEVTEDVNEYAYEVTFSAQNLTRTEKVVSFTAGGGTQTLILQPGENATDLVVRSALGAALHVEAGGMVRNFDITY